MQTAIGIYTRSKELTELCNSTMLEYLIGVDSTFPSPLTAGRTDKLHRSRPNNMARLVVERDHCGERAH